MYIFLSMCYWSYEYLLLRSIHFDTTYLLATAGARCRDMVHWPCVWKPYIARTSPWHPLLFLSSLFHPYILTIFLENLCSFLVGKMKHPVPSPHRECYCTLISYSDSVPSMHICTHYCKLAYWQSVLVQMAPLPVLCALVIQSML